MFTQYLLCFQSFRVIVNEKPYFITKPMSKLYPPAKTVRLECQAGGIPTPEVHWLKNGTLLQVEGRIKKQPTGLVLSHSFTEDAGTDTTCSLILQNKLRTFCSIQESISALRSIQWEHRGRPSSFHQRFPIRLLHHRTSAAGPLMTPASVWNGRRHRTLQYKLTVSIPFTQVAVLK